MNYDRKKSASLLSAFKFSMSEDPESWKELRENAAKRSSSDDPETSRCSCGISEKCEERFVPFAHAFGCLARENPGSEK